MAKQASTSPMVATNPPRPILVTVVCVFALIGGVFAFGLMFTETARAIAPWYPPMLGLSGVGGMICLFGIWMMRKWGVYAYIALTVIVQITLLATGLWTPTALILPFAFIVVLSIYLPRMR